MRRSRSADDTVSFSLHHYENDAKVTHILLILIFYVQVHVSYLIGSSCYFSTILIHLGGAVVQDATIQYSFTRPYNVYNVVFRHQKNLLT